MSPFASKLIFDNMLNCSTISPTHDNWSQIRRVLEKVHEHVCGHYTYYDMRTLIQRTNLWNGQTENYLLNVVSKCPDCNASSTPPPNRRVSLASLNREFNDVVCMNHMFLDKVTLFDMMNVATRFPVGAVVGSTSMENVIYHKENLWFSQFWPSNFIHADGAFQNEIMKTFLYRYDVKIRPAPPRRHEKTPMETRNRTISSFLYVSNTPSLPRPIRYVRFLQ